MDSFDDFDFLSLDSPASILGAPASDVREEDDTMRQLTDADSRLGYGGYCVIS
ncbi:hypothetical protein BDZ97DRAFT_1821349 [Flammula alnicola]|nr:hypothetical protein BDZ97DRAFT_1821349 [Flammula alnicola]